MLGVVIFVNGWKVLTLPFISTIVSGDNYRIKASVFQV